MPFERAKTYEEALARLKAVIIADTFENHLGPLVHQRSPQCLLSVAGVPNLHYIIEFLVMNEVKEIVIAIRNQHKEAVKDFIKTQGYKGKAGAKSVTMPGNTKVTVCGISNDAESFGDVLRHVADLDGLIMDDFVVVRGDIITNINF